MECNKDEALRAKEISEAKLAEKDFVGAKEYAEKARKLFKGLEGISQLLLIIDVHISSEQKINGEPDWYGVLGVAPTADDETIRKNYKMLVLHLHPDKNKLVGAEGAFKLVCQAWKSLSDKVKKNLYDQNRNPRPVYEPVTLTQPTPPIPRPSNLTTFWTSCSKCSLQFEYLKFFLNQVVLCQNCHEPFWAKQVLAPPMNHHPTMMDGPRLGPSGVNHLNVTKGPSCANHVNAPRDLSSKPSVNHMNVPKVPSFNTPPVNRFKNRQEAKVAEMRSQASNSGSGHAPSDGTLKRKRLDEQPSMVHVRDEDVRNVNIERRGELSRAETRLMLVKKAKNVILNHLNELKAKTAGKMPLKATMPIDDMDDDVDTDMTDSKATLMSVPDPDFHDFDMDRTERSFSENEVWAAYDQEDGMPRYYAMIHRVPSTKPFRMQISWLNTKTNAEFGLVNWVSSGFTKTSGDFRMGKPVINTSLNSFSHKVEWAKGKKGVIQVYPKKGNVWAVYRNWSRNWNEFTPNEDIHKYDMVAVVDDFNEEKGVVVAPLVKVAGFKSVFRVNADVTEARTIPKDEIFQLSHQVPFHVLTGEESVNISEGCLELDPAALPLELLQTTTEPEAKAVEDGSCSINTEAAKEMVTYSRKKAKKPETSGS